MAAITGAPGTGEGGEAAEPDSDRMPGVGGFSQLELETRNSDQKRDMLPSPPVRESQCSACHESQAAVQLAEPGLSLTGAPHGAGAPVTKQEAAGPVPSPPGVPGKDGEYMEFPQEAGKEAVPWRVELYGQPEPPDSGVPGHTQDQGAPRLVTHVPVDVRLRTCAGDMAGGPLGSTAEVFEPYMEISNTGDVAEYEVEQSVNDHSEMEIDATVVDADQWRVSYDHVKSPAGMKQKPPWEDEATSRANLAITEHEEPMSGSEAEVVRPTALVHGEQIGLARAPIFREESNHVKEMAQKEQFDPNKVSGLGETVGLALVPIDGEAFEFVSETVHGEEVDLETAQVHGEEFDLETAQVLGEEVDLETAQVHGEEVDLETAQVHGEEVDLETAQVHGEEFDLETAQVHVEEVDLETAQVHVEEVDLETAQVHVEEVDLETAQVHVEEVDLETAQVHGEEVDLETAQVHEEEVDLETAQVHGEEVDLETAQVHVEEVDLETAQVHEEEVDLETAQVHEEEVDLETAQVHGEEVDLETAQVHGEEVDLEIAQVHGEEVDLETAQVHGEEVDLETAQVHGEEVDLETAQVHGEEVDLETAQVHGEEVDLETAQVHGEEVDLETAQVHGEEVDLETAQVHGEEVDLETAQVHGEEVDRETAQVHGEEVDLETAQVHGEEVDRETAQVHGEEVDRETAQVHGEEVDRETAQVHGEEVDRETAHVHGEEVDRENAHVHGEEVDRENAHVHGEEVDRENAHVYGEEVDRENVYGEEVDRENAHVYGEEVDRENVYGEEVDRENAHVYGEEVDRENAHVYREEVDRENAHVYREEVDRENAHVYGEEVERENAQVCGEEVDLENAQFCGEEVDLDHAQIREEEVDLDNAKVHGDEGELVQMSLPDEGRNVQASDVVLFVKEAVEMKSVAVCVEAVKLFQKRVTEDKVELQKMPLPEGGKVVSQVRYTKVQTLISEEQTRVSLVSDPAEADLQDFDSECVAKVHDENVDAKSELVGDLVPEITIHFQKRTCGHVQDVCYEATQEAPVYGHDKDGCKSTVAGEMILLSNVPPGRTLPRNKSEETEPVPDEVHNSKKQPFMVSQENEDIPNMFNQVIAQNHVLQPGIQEEQPQYKPTSRQKERCPKPGELINRLFEPLLKLDKANTGGTTNKFNFVHKEVEVVPRNLLEITTGLESASASMDIDICHKTIHMDRNLPMDDAVNTGPLGKGIVASLVPMETVNIEATSDYFQIGACSQQFNTSCGVPEEQLAGEKISHPSPVTGETLDEELDVKCDTNVKLCTEEQNPPDSSPNPDRPSNDSEHPCVPHGAYEGFVIRGIDGLTLGSQVEVTLDHIIQDALVVSFQHGDRLFSGVLMDLSKRFGPHGIPVTIHPKRDYQNRPVELVQSFPGETQEKSEESGTVSDGLSHVDSSEPCKIQSVWTSKPPPLFHEGAPYPPPLFIRDTYNQSIPQPPPRKIKRLRKRIYREEPTSIMNAIKLRPRQVLCDKCKNVVSDIRKGVSDSFNQEQGKRRRHENVTTVTKRLKTDHKVNGKSQSEGQKKNVVSKVSNLNHNRAKVAPQTSSAKAQLHNKKVLQSKNMDHAKAREVLKMAKEKVHKRQKETNSSKNAHGKVHFTRRLQNTSSGTLPPRLRIKPQRYRNEENDSSVKKGLESLRSSNIGIKPQTRYSATRSAGEVSSEIQSPTNGPEEASSVIQDTSVCEPPAEQPEPQTLSKRGSKSNITVYMTLNQTKADSSTASVCSSDGTDDLKSSHSECSSTETFDFPPGSMHAPSSSKEEKTLSTSLKIKVFSKNVSKCVTTDGRTICVGDIVWAKIYGFPWWPARILTITVTRKDNGLLVRQEARISWFGSPTTSFLALSQLSPFLENFQSRFNKKRKGLYRKAITEAAKAAKQLTPEVRALLTQFET
uniref:PWWP domain-containing protein 2A n=1 Tax=Leptobrachium leishanense TaxID=445787 RepID=A0A8C5MAJ9_9ANUR